MHSQDCNRSLMLVFHIEKGATVSGFVCFPSALLFVVSHFQSDYITFRMTKVKDTKLIQAVILFKVEANNSLIFFAITNIRKKNCRVSVPVQPIIPWYNVLCNQNCLQFKSLPRHLVVEVSSSLTSSFC